MNTNYGSDPAEAAWAKSGDDSVYLSVRQHLVDTFGVAQQLWDEFVPRSLKASLARREKLSLDALKCVAVFLAGVHDVGKLTISCLLYTSDAADDLQPV